MSKKSVNVQIESKPEMMKVSTPLNTFLDLHFYDSENVLQNKKLVHGESLTLPATHANKDILRSFLEKGLIQIQNI